VFEVDACNVIVEQVVGCVVSETVLCEVGERPCNTMGRGRWVLCLVQAFV